VVVVLELGGEERETKRERESWEKRDKALRRIPQLRSVHLVHSELRRDQARMLGATKQEDTAPCRSTLPSEPTRKHSTAQHSQIEACTPALLKQPHRKASSPVISFSGVFGPENRDSRGWMGRKGREVREVSEIAELRTAGMSGLRVVRCHYEESESEPESMS